MAPCVVHADAEPSTATVMFNAIGSDPVAVLSGPTGDWPANVPLVFNATASSDPDVGYGVPSGLTFSWDCRCV